MNEDELENGEIATATNVNNQRLVVSVEGITEDGDCVVQFKRPRADPALSPKKVGKPVVVSENESAEINLDLRLDLSLHSSGQSKPFVGDIGIETIKTGQTGGEDSE